MSRTWKKLTLQIKHESFREQLYEWFMDKDPYGFWEKEALTVVAYLRQWPDEPYPDYVVEVLREEEPDENWAEEWRKSYKPIVINNSITIRPPWENASSTPIDVVIYPAYAFGTGDHPTTWFCMQFISRYLKPQMSFFDIGMGSGILSILAIRLGAGEVTSIDIDPLALEELKRNCVLNQIDFERIRSNIVDLSAVRGHFDFIVANIGSQFQLENLPAMLERLNRSGYLVLSGFQVDDSFSIQKLAQSFPLQMVESESKENWVTQVYQKR